MEANMNLKHGLFSGGKIPLEYWVYKAAKRRCTNPNDKAWHNYGGRGIRFLFKSFQEFLAAVGRKPSPQYRLDRINNDGHYQKGNVRWVTFEESQRNRRFVRGGYCRWGHKLEGDNLIYKRGGVACRQCTNDRMYLYKALKKSLAGLKLAQQQRLLITLYRELFGSTPTFTQITTLVRAGVLRKWAKGEQARKERKQS
jgi:hypothetical protein